MSYAIFTAVRAANVATITTEDIHPFAAGDKITVSGILGGKGATFNGDYTVATKVSNYAFTYASIGTAGTADQSISLSSVARYLTTANQIQVVTSAAHGIVAGREVPVRISGVTQNSGTALAQLIGGTTSVLYAKNKVKVIDSTTLVLTLSRNVTSWTPVLSGGSLLSSSISGVVDFTAIDNPEVPVTPPTPPVVTKRYTETQLVKAFYTLVNNAKASDPYVQRLVNTSDTTKITSNTANARIDISVPATTLRSALDSVIEVFSDDLKKRRYYINLSQQLVYEIVDDTVPTYATAPYVLTVGTAINPNTSTAKSTINPFSLGVSWDHDTTKRAVFTLAGTGTAPKVSAVTYNSSDALGSSYTRNGAPILDGVVDYPNSVDDQTTATSVIAKSFFLERHAPVLSITAEIRGAGTASWNQYGFSSGYYQTGASTYALQSRWEPGQYVEIQAAELSLSGLYRIEQVEWGLEPGKFQQVIRITANRRPPTTLTALLGKK